MAFEEENLDAGFLTSGSNSHRTGRHGKRYHPVFGRTGRGRVVRSLGQFSAIWETSLAGHWPLDEVSGTRYDVLGASPLDDNNGVSWEPGKIGNAATFDSSLVQYLSCPSNSNLQLAGTPFTIALWVNLDAVTGNRPFIWKYDEDTGQREYALGYEAGHVVLRVYPGGTLAGVQSISTSSGLSADTWYFVVAGLDTSNRIYIRVYQPGYTTLAAGGGVLATITGGSLVGTSAPLRVGYGNVPGYIFDGTMDSLSIWKRSLSLDEEMALFNQGLGFEPPLPGLPRRHPGRVARAWQEPWQGFAGRTHRGTVPNQNVTPSPYVGRRIVNQGCQEAWRAFPGRVVRGRVPHDYIVEHTYLVDELGNYIVDELGNFIIVSTGSIGIESQPIIRSRFARPPVRPSPGQFNRGHAWRADVPRAEFEVHARRVCQGWRGSAPPSRGQVTRHRLPMLRGLERFPHRFARGWTAGRLPVPFTGRSHRGDVPGSGLVASPIARGRMARPPSRPAPAPGHNRRGQVMGTGGVAAQVVLRHQVVSSVQPPPRPGLVFRMPVPPSGLINVPIVRQHALARAASAPPWSGRVRRSPVPNQGQVALPIVSSRQAKAPRAPLALLRGRSQRASGRRMHVLSNTGYVIGGRYYATAGQIYVAGAVAGQVVVE